MGTLKDSKGKKKNWLQKLRSKEGKKQIPSKPNQLRKTETLHGSPSHTTGRGFWDRAGRELSLMPATLNGLNSDSEDNDLTSEEDEENHSDSEKAKSSPHTLHPKKAQSRNEDSTNLQRGEARAFQLNMEARKPRIRSKVTIADKAGPEIWKASEVLVTRICQSPNPEARFENVVE